MEYIEREELITKLNDMAWDLIKVNSIQRNIAAETVAEIKYNIVAKQPTADVVEVRHSYWQCSNVRMSSRDITCRYCHRTETINNGNEDFDYCPHCGAKMDEKDGEQRKIL